MLKWPGIFLCGILLTASGNTCTSQPYFDPAGLSMWHIPEDITGHPASETEVNIFLSLPLEMGKGNKLVISPYYEKKDISFEADGSVQLHSTAFPLTWLHYINDSTWSFTLTGIVRSNSTQYRTSGDVFQYGGACVGTYRVNPKLKLRAGLYYNKEFFSDFFVPLVGIEWKINERLNLFGLFPNSMKLEYELTKKFFAGVAFKSITNSYRVRGDGGYFKISDNHLGLYSDLNLIKQLVWNLEIGHTLFRSVKGRNGAGFPEIDHDGVIVKTGLVYRIRLE